MRIYLDHNATTPVRDEVVDRLADEDDPLLEEARVDVIRALTPSGPLDDDRHEGVHGHAAANPELAFDMLDALLETAAHRITVHALLSSTW